MTKPILAICAGAMFLLFSCKKDNASSTKNNGSTTWLSGKWDRTYYCDTVFDAGSIFGINEFPVNINENTINFNSSASGTSTFDNDVFTYSFSGLTLIYANYPNSTWHIHQISATKLELYIQATGVSFGDFYTKEN